MGVLKLLYEQPERLRLLIVNFIKLLLTVAIIQKVCHQSKLNDLNDFIDNKVNINADGVLLYSVILVFTWFIIWFVGDAIFLLLMSIRIEKTEAVKDIQKQSFLPILRISGAFRIDNQAFLPGRNILPIAELAESMSAKHQQMKSTLFADVLFIAIVGWTYLWLNHNTFHIPCWVIVTMLLIIALLCYVYRSMDSMLRAFQDSSSIIVVFLNMMVYKEMVNGVLKNMFNAKYNSEKKCFELDWKGVLYQVGDVGFQSNEHGNSHLIGMLSDPDLPDDHSAILITNVKPNETLKSLISKGKFAAYVVADNEAEVVDNLIIALEQLNTRVKTQIENLSNILPA